MKIDISSLMEQAKVLQAEFEASKKNVEKVTATGESGAGMVVATINGANHLLSIDIAPEIINSNEKKMLEDLVVAAVNNAYQQIAELTTKEMNKFSSMLPNLPNLQNL